MFELKFLGNGSAFNTKRGNNSAFMIDDRALLLIDCGGLIFDKILRTDLLSEIDTIDVIITHLHPDHIGSLGDLIFYSHFMLNKKANIHFPAKLALTKLLNIFGIDETMYNYIDGPFKFNNKIIISSIDVKHDPRSETSYGYVLSDEEGNVTYYSGDANMIPDVILHTLGNSLVTDIYQDVSSKDYEGNVHLSLKKLAKLVPKSFRSKVHCMHLDADFDDNYARGLGFKVTETIISEESTVNENMYITVPTLIKAIRLDWNSWSDVCNFVKRPFFKSGVYLDDNTLAVLPEGMTSNIMGLRILTDDGEIIAKQGDYIIKDENGAYRVCSEHIFKILYQQIKQII